MAKKTPLKSLDLPASLGTSVEREGFAVPQNATQPLEHVTVAPCSIDFARDAKGVARWAIKLTGERAEMLSLVDEIHAIDAKLRGQRTTGTKLVAETSREDDSDAG